MPKQENHTFLPYLFLAGSIPLVDFTKLNLVIYDLVLYFSFTVYECRSIFDVLFSLLCGVSITRTDTGTETIKRNSIWVCLSAFVSFLIGYHTIEV